ncbi:rRNA maturation RNase YbeY [Dermabacter sp. Marseille-Q3180]|uniref:rRNA maturation RNase YbeY n=1 Tax=Dermabacter sp. Marseille-Q3180 TaxID=2758090 RepID=UPI00202574FA|nr:rRNA maturation RNase YbeY [Dermabacter sp. Marseille-Q3180]
MSIEVNNETTAKIDAREFVDLARYVFDAMFLHPATELSITFVDESAMSDLHEEWMDLEGPTDVMSFPMDELREGTEGELAPEGLLGDIVICPSVAATQARIAGHSTEEEMLLLLTHGILHLLGYDHVEPEDERVMFTLQRKLLLTFLAGRTSRVGISDTGGPRP